MAKFGAIRQFDELNRPLIEAKSFSDHIGDVIERFREISTGLSLNEYGRHETA